MNQPSLTPERIMQFAWGYAPTLMIETAVRHGIFDLLDKGPRTLEEVASQTGASERGVRALLNALVGIQLLTRQGDKYALAHETAEFLVKGKPAYHGMFFAHASEQLIPQWLKLADVVKSGKPVKKVEMATDGAEFFANFVESLFPLSFGAASVLGQHLGVPKASSPIRVLDIGAGSGVWGIALARQSPQVRIRAVDWPQVLEITKRVAQRHGVAERLTTAPGDFAQADFGRDHQIATIGHILHSEGPDRSRSLLKKVFDAMAAGGVVAIQEFVPNDDRTGPANALIFAVNMLVNTESGDTFTFPEMREWLLQAGFVNPRLLDVPAVSPLVLADKPK